MTAEKGAIESIGAYEETLRRIRAVQSSSDSDFPEGVTRKLVLKSLLTNAAHLRERLASDGPHAAGNAYARVLAEGKK